ncbi:hypothetical protein E5K00_09580 [Hymenobacter aquaticus]|uniref:Outer membrane protein beta-barrel domain-containing protein n=1 Tax=Hymenobacter aquaticus TaxID=1867101 RepID=A0A4Z0Q7N7_9BACT|nr:hypothetical protein [Hymenobacter aquaticus]TGE25419.1 hypothetical protein E5K00_09580 [Hymenobacter aquaticus]
MKLPLLSGLLLGLLPAALCQAQTAPRPDTVPISRFDSRTKAVTTVEVDSLDFIKATAINEAIFKNFGGQVFFGLGYARANYDGLNGVLRQAGYPVVDEGQFAYGGGGSFRFRHVVLGLEAVAYEFKKEDQDRKTLLTSSNVTNYLGYAWLNANQSQCFTPTLGVTYGAADITLTDQSLSGSTTALGLLTSPAYSRTLHYRSTALALGAHYEFYPFDAAVLKRCVVGLHVTYSARLGRGRYYADDYKQKIEGPDLNPAWLSARAVFGFVL